MPKLFCFSLFQMQAAGNKILNDTKFSVKVWGTLIYGTGINSKQRHVNKMKWWQPILTKDETIKIYDYKCGEIIASTEIIPTRSNLHRWRHIFAIWFHYNSIEYSMGLLSDTQNCGLRMRPECRERIPHHRLQRKLIVSDPGMHHGTCVTHVSWCMSGSLIRGGGENVPGIPAHAQPAVLRIW